LGLLRLPLAIAQLVVDPLREAAVSLRERVEVGERRIQQLPPVPTADVLYQLLVCASAP
jgi:hypothetical protein